MIYWQDFKSMGNVKAITIKINKINIIKPDHFCITSTKILIYCQIMAKYVNFSFFHNIMHLNRYNINLDHKPIFFFNHIFRNTYNNIKFY